MFRYNLNIINMFVPQIFNEEAQVNYPSLTEGACCWSPSCPWAWIHRTATIGWLTFPCQGKEAIHYPFRAPLHSLVPAEGLRRVFLLLTENMPLEPMCSCELSNLTVLLFRRVPYHFRCGQNIHCMGLLEGSLSSPRQVKGSSRSHQIRHRRVRTDS